MNINHLRYAMAVEEHGHFRRAARHLGISQPALSRAVKGLENELGVVLFDRGRRGCTVTEGGAVILASARQLLLAAEDLVRESELLRDLEGRLFRVSLAPYPAARSGHRALAELMARRPQTHLQVRTARWQEALESLVVRDADLAIAELTDEILGDPRLSTEPVARERGVFCCRLGHPLLSEDRIAGESILHYPWVAPRLPGRVAEFLKGSTACAAGWRDQVSGDFVPSVEVDDVGQIPTVVAESDALGAVTLSMIERELCGGQIAVLPLDLNWFRLNYGFVHLARRTLSTTCREYMEIVRMLEEKMAETDDELWRRFVRDADEPRRTSPAPPAKPSRDRTSRRTRQP
jgi:DNA-binding transcriptional LysR family regulator